MLLFVYLFGGAIRTGTRLRQLRRPRRPARLRRLRRRHHRRQRQPRPAPPASSTGSARWTSAARRVIAGHVVASVAAQPRLDACCCSASLWRSASGRPPRRRRGSRRPASSSCSSSRCPGCAPRSAWSRVPRGGGGLTFPISFLPYPSSAFVPIHTMPSWLQGFAAQSTGDPASSTPSAACSPADRSPRPQAGARLEPRDRRREHRSAGVLFRRRLA